MRERWTISEKISSPPVMSTFPVHVLASLPKTAGEKNGDDEDSTPRRSPEPYRRCQKG